MFQQTSLAERTAIGMSKVKLMVKLVAPSPRDIEQHPSQHDMFDRSFRLWQPSDKLVNEQSPIASINADGRMPGKDLTFAREYRDAARHVTGMQTTEGAFTGYRGSGLVKRVPVVFREQRFSARTGTRSSLLHR